MYVKFSKIREKIILSSLELFCYSYILYKEKMLRDKATVKSWNRRWARSFLKAKYTLSGLSVGFVNERRVSTISSEHSFAWCQNNIDRYYNSRFIASDSFIKGTTAQIDSSTIDGNVEFVYSQYSCILTTQVSI